jgi:uncharacterized membrane protein YfcA
VLGKIAVMFLTAAIALVTSTALGVYDWEPWYWRCAVALPLAFASWHAAIWIDSKFDRIFG